MPVVYPVLQFRGFPTLFGDIRDTNVTFVLDTSESMQAHFSTVKYHLVETLLAKAYSTNYTRFNIVEFSNKVTKWCDRIVTCSPQTVYSAIQWIQSLSCTLGRNLLGALTAAFDDPVIPVYPADLSTSGPLYSDLKYCTVKRALNNNPYIGSRVDGSDPETFLMYPVSADSPQVTAGIWKYADPREGPLGSSQLISGASVLARRESDGFYYRGTIRQEVEVRKGLFLIEFDKSTKDPSEKWKASVQKTALHDIIQYNEAMRHSVVPGDKVLAPWESDETRYGPGTVVFGIETRNPLQVMEDDELSINFWNGKTVKVSRNVAMWIQSALYERVRQELLTPLSSRQQLKNEELSTCCDVCPLRPQTVPVHLCHFEPTYIQSCYSGFPSLDPYNDYWQGFYCGFNGLPAHSVCYCFPEVISPVAWWPMTPRSTNATAFDKEELDKKVTSQLQELDFPKKKIPEENLLSSSSSSSSSEDSDSSPEPTVSKPTLEDRMVNTDVKLLEKRRTSVKDRPDWKYWSQSHQEPHQKKPGTLSSSPLKSFSDSSQLISSMQLQNLGPTNRCAVFENIDRIHHQNRITMKEVLTHQKHDIPSSTRIQAPPIQERLGENQLLHDCQHQEAVQRSRKKKLQLRQWEKDREQQSEDKYQRVQAQRREKVIQHLQNHCEQVADCERKLEETNRAKQHLHQKTQTRIQSIASEDKEREAQRLAYLQQVTARKDSIEAEKVKADEIKEIQKQEARRKQVELRNKMIAEKLHKAEKLTEERERGRRKHQIKRVSSF
ncbi:uncharacterized protein C11orf16 homolog isoform X2 [Heterodontus francisci]|uniref:uncharacterized protein C11orf16 homolog isoform X2 n=1 Tax=Heterodontus francisci TaxID=7792 RepID=UPI00355B4482